MLSSTAPEPTGLHVRAGNAMQRTRDGLLDGALDCLAAHGVRGTTMSAIATAGGVAKGTLYNHFRTKADVWQALADRELRRIAAQAGATSDPATALDVAAREVGGLPAVRSMAATEPEALVPLLTPTDSAPWLAARDAVAMVLRCPVEDPAVELALRWLISQLLAPEQGAGRAAAAGRLASLVGPALRSPGVHDSFSPASDEPVAVPSG